jgi:hypothetical protein
MIVLGGCSSLPECISLEVSKYWLFIQLMIASLVWFSTWFAVIYTIMYSNTIFSYVLMEIDFHKLV